MDPNATLKEIRELVAANDQGALDEYEVARLVDLISALDLWLTHGGFLPAEW